MVINVENLRKTFHLHTINRRVVSLDGVSLHVNAGEHVAVAGSSGAGKSSLLRCIYRNYLPDSGTVTLFTDQGPVELTALSDREMARIRGQELGYVAQFLKAPPRTGPFDFVVASALRRQHPRAEAEELAAQALRGLNITEALWQVDCAVLSGGERQRVNLAAGLVSPPRLMLLDEPVSALDPANREHALAMIDQLTESGVAVIAVYHDMNVIRRLADRVIVMENGRIAIDADADTALTHSSLVEEYA